MVKPTQTIGRLRGLKSRSTAVCDAPHTLGSDPFPDRVTFPNLSCILVGSIFFVNIIFMFQFSILLF
jgi:hypothetical protein